MNAMPRAGALPGPVRRLTVAVAGAVAALAGCAVGPDYRRPEAVAAMPERYAGSGPDWKVATPQEDLAKGPWWEIFGDAELNGLQAQAMSANRELEAAAARFDQARLAVGGARSGRSPRVGGAASAAVQHDSANRPLNTTGKAAGRGFTYDNFVLPLDASYELDLWGRVRRQVEGAQAAALAGLADLEGARLSIAAEVASDYFALRALQAEALALSASIEAYRKALELTRERRRGGLGSDLDVAQAETVLTGAEAQLPPLRQASLRYLHAMAVLVGQPASTFQVREAAAPGEPPKVRPDVPSALLERRPDVAAAERRMAAANASIGVAKAAFFPTIRLTGLAGLQSLDAGTFFDWPSRFWAVGPSLSLPLFDGGQRRAALGSAEGRYEETVALYRQTVLRAFAEVEDQLAAQRLVQEQLDLERAALRSSQRQLQLAENRYRGGLASYLQVAAAQSVALEHERTVVRLRGQQFVACVNLVRALGGGWTRSGAWTKGAGAD